MSRSKVFTVCLLLALLSGRSARAQTAGAQTAAATPGTATALYQQLASAALDPTQIFHIRDADLRLEDLHLSFDEGAIAFTEAIDGRVTGAFFAGQGSVLVIPPDQVERASLSLFTKSAVLEERFTSAYLRFNDPAIAQALKSSLRGPEPNKVEFFHQYSGLARSLAVHDALRLTLALLNSNMAAPHTFFHASIAGVHFGTFEAFYDQLSPEAITVAKVSAVNQELYDDVWLSFPARSQRAQAAQALLRPAGGDHAVQTEELHPDENGIKPLIDIRAYDIATTLEPPAVITAHATLHMRARQAGIRAALFQLSRKLKVTAVRLDGASIEFLQNPAVAGSQTARQGDDLVAVIFPAALANGAGHQLEFSYSGAVMTDTGGGLLYVGDRGTWYPNLGPKNADFHLTFRFPREWTLVATGAALPLQTAGAETVAEFRSVRPLPLAGFNLGHFTMKPAVTASRHTEVRAYAGTKIEQAAGYDPAAQEQRIADRGAKLIDALEAKLGPFPYQTLSITQLPGDLSQGWPGLIYLASISFVADNPGIKFTDAYRQLAFQDLIPAHETGHQYWGDNVSWRSYREQWIMEALANYCALLMIEPRKPGSTAIALSYYHDDLLGQAEGDTIARYQAGPVTLGSRLNSSQAPDGYQSITYGRGTWLIHMLRSMLRDASELEAKPGGAAGDPDSRFWRALASLQQQFAGKAIGDNDFQRAFERVMPRAMQYEHTANLDWFFDGWVNGSDIPRFALAGVKITAGSASGTSASGKIRESDAGKDLTTLLPIYAELADGTRVLAAQVFADGAESDFTIAVPAGTRQLLLDPEREVLRQ